VHGNIAGTLTGAAIGFENWILEQKKRSGVRCPFFTLFSLRCSKSDSRRINDFQRREKQNELFRKSEITKGIFKYPDSF
jgi:hypothetical protein